MASKINKSATGGTKSDLKIKKTVLKNLSKDIKFEVDDSNSKKNVKDGSVNKKEVSKKENLNKSKINKEPLKKVRETSILKSSEVIENKKAVKKAVSKSVKKQVLNVSSKKTKKMEKNLEVVSEVENKKENKKIIQVIRNQSITSNNNNNNNSEDNENMNNLKVKEDVKSDIYIKTDVKISEDKLKPQVETQPIQIQDPGFLGNDDVFDETDLAQWQQLREQADIHHRAMQLNKPETHPDFNGKECVECGDVIPESRLKMHKVRCVDCQTDLEQEKLRNNRNYNFNNKNTPTDWGD